MAPRACCIESDEKLLRQLVELLDTAGWHVTSRNGIEFHDYDNIDCFDLVVTTNAAGHAHLTFLVEQVRTHFTCETTPIILIGLDQTADASNHAFEAGITEVFSWNNPDEFHDYLQGFGDGEVSDIAGKRILILEDDVIQGTLLHRILAREQFIPALYQTLEDALNATETTDFDAAVTDLVLGQGQSGASFIRRLRQQPGRSANIPIIAVSGFEDDARRMEALRAGAECFLQKPVVSAELLLHLRRLLDRQQRRREHPYRDPVVALEADTDGRLTERERLICALAISGHRDKQIAQEVGISYWTVRTHLAHIFRKFDVTNRVGLAAAIHASGHATATPEHWPEIAASIVERAPVGVIVTDEESRIVGINRAYCEITGFRREELIGMTPRMVRSQRHPPEFHRRLLKTLSANGRWSGNVWNRTKHGREFLGSLNIRRLPPGLPMNATYVGLLNDITQEHTENERLRERSLHDPLTGLANRLLLRNRTQYEIARARRTRRTLALAFIDLDGFKPINDVHGHAAGDNVLQEVAARLAARLRDNDTLARTGGDEFVILLPDVPQRGAAGVLGERLLDAFRMPFGSHGTYGHIGASIGFSFYPDDGEDFDALLAHADEAMYGAKRSGGRRIAFFERDASPTVATSAGDPHRFNSALGNNEFELQFQPQFAIDRDRIVGAEALLRWHDPRHGLLAAMHFIPTAERTGSIVELGAWALRNACAALAALRRAGHRHFRMAVNVSPLQILRGKPFAEDVLTAIAAFEVPAGQIELEVSEGVFLHNAELAMEALGALAASGVSLALDGIGKDYFSPGYLRHLPFRSIKIDRRCTTGATGDAYCDSILRSSLLLAERIGLDAIAEGVENLEQLALLREIGYRHAQGNLLGHPVSLDNLLHLLDIKDR